MGVSIFSSKRLAGWQRELLLLIVLFRLDFFHLFPYIFVILIKLALGPGNHLGLL